MVRLLPLALLSLPLASLAATLPRIVPPVPIVIWHGLGDRWDSPGLIALKESLETNPNLKGVFVWIVKLDEDGSSDTRATFLGNTHNQVQFVCDQLEALPEIVDPELNPGGKFDAVGFSQGGQLMRAVVERCGKSGEVEDLEVRVGKGKKANGLRVRNLITLGSQHMGVSAIPPCPPGTSPFSACRLMQLGIVREGMYSSFAQHNIVPAQYFRDEARIDDFLRINTFLKDINNERNGDKEVGPYIPPDLPFSWESTFERKVQAFDEDEPDEEPRNATYKANLAALENLVLIRFSADATVVPPQSAHFTLPSPNATNCPSLPVEDPLCYLDPVPYSKLPLYAEDYIGLKQLSKEGKVTLGVCEGQHMEINEECWEGLAEWFGEGVKNKSGIKWWKMGEGEEVVDGGGSGESAEEGRFVLQGV